jgi:hypothetical protein
MSGPECKYRFVHEYLTCVRRAFQFYRDNPTGKIKTDWACKGKTEEQFRKWFLDALDRRINSKGGLVEIGRKYDSLYQIAMYRDCMAARDHSQRRIRIYQFETVEARRRLSHLLSRYDD